MPHVWACLSDVGTLLVGVQSAGTLEAFFKELAKLPERPTKKQVEGLHKAHGMIVVGEPLKV